MKSHALLALVTLTIVSPVSCANGLPQEPEKKAFYTGQETGDDRTRVPLEREGRHPAFLANRLVEIEGTVGDAFVGGETVRIPGTVQGNAFVGCRTVHVDGLVEGDLFFFGETALIAGELRGDLYGFFNEVRVLEGGVIGGDLYAGGERVWVEGSIGGRIVGGLRRLDVRGSVGEDVFVACERVEIYEGARIAGDLLYDSPSDPIIRDESSVAGRVERVVYNERDANVEFRHAGNSLVWEFLGAAVLFLSTLLIGVILLLAAESVIARPAALLAEKPALGLGLGFVTFVVFPILALFLCLLPPVGLFFLALFGMVVFLARIVTAQCIGTWILGKLGAGSAHPIAGLIVGLVIFYAATLIPYLGNLIWFVWVLSGLGGIALALRGSRVS